MGGEAETTDGKWPRVRPISANVSAKIGFSNDRVKVMVRTNLPWPVPKEIALWLDPDDVPRVEQVLKDWREWMAKPQAEREFTGESAT